MQPAVSHDPPVKPELAVHLYLAGETGIRSGELPLVYARPRRLRPLVQGSLPELHARVLLQADFVAGQGALLDARADFDLTDEFQVHLGQQVVPFTRAWHIPLHLVPLGDRSLSNNTFAPGRRLGALGIWKHGALSAEVGVFDPASDIAAPRYPMGLARLQLQTEGARPDVGIPGRVGDTSGLAFGLAGLVEPGVGTTHLVKGTVDVTGHTKGFSFLAEGFAATDPDRSVGASLQLQQLLPVPWLDVIARGELLQQERLRRRAEAGLTAYGHGADFAVRLQGHVDDASGRGLKLYGSVRI